MAREPERVTPRANTFSVRQMEWLIQIPGRYDLDQFLLAGSILGLFRYDLQFQLLRAPDNYNRRLMADPILRQ